MAKCHWASNATTLSKKPAAISKRQELQTKHSQNREFLKSRKVLFSKTKQLVFEKAKGNRPHGAKKLSNAEEDLLFRSGEFGDENTEALQRTVWWLMALHFGFLARDESRKLKWGDIVLQTDNETGNEVLIWKSERARSKTRRVSGDTRTSI